MVAMSMSRSSMRAGGCCCSCPTGTPASIPHPGDPQGRPYGNGVLLWFATDDFEAALARIRHLLTEILEGPHVNPNANHREVWVRDPDGYVVVIAGTTGDV